MKSSTIEALEFVRDRIQERRTELIHAATMLSDNMATLARRLREMPDYEPGDLGVVQMQGPNVDRLCALLRAEQRALELLERVAKEE